MSDTYGRTYALPLMRYDLASLSWRTCEDTSLWDLEMSSPTFPESGTTLDGLLYERPRQAPAIAGQDSSSLPTPQSGDSHNEALDRGRNQKTSPYSDLPRSIAQFPTPAARDYKDQNFSPRVLDGRSHGELPEAIGLQFLPTPTSVQGRNATSGRKTDAVFKTGTTLQDVVYAGDIGGSTSKPLEDGKQSRGKPLAQQSKEMEGQDSLLSLLNG